jgi:hypothetical protein
MKQPTHTPRSGAERQKAYRAGRRSVSIDITEATAHRIRALRNSLSLTTDAALSRALDALETALAVTTNGTGKPARRRGGGAKANARTLPSPGDNLIPPTTTTDGASQNSPASPAKADVNRSDPQGTLIF